MTDLYPRLMGQAWERLDEAVRQFHGTQGGLRASGTFRIESGERWLARLMARGLGLPRASEAVALQLEVTPQGEGERWSRQFGPDQLVSAQQPGPENILIERHGLAEFRFQLREAGGALVYETHSVAVGLGPLRLSLPRWLAPQVTAREAPGTQPNRVLTQVTIRAPLVGLLLQYEGEVEIEGVDFIDNSDFATNNTNLH